MPDKERVVEDWRQVVDVGAFHACRHGVLRFNGLKLYIPDISKKMLSVALKTFEADGLVSRKVYAEVPPRVEYSLRERGMSLIPLIDSLINWAKANMDDILADRNSYLIHNS